MDDFDFRRLSPAALWPPIVVCAILGMLVWRTPDGVLDDAFILFRYARHIGLGLGPVWNVGGPPTEGYTSFLYVLLLALPGRWGWSLPLVAQGVNLVAAWVCVGTLYWAVRKTGGGRWVAVAICSCLALNPFAVRHAGSGMETALYMALLTGFWALLLPVAGERRFAWAFGVGFLAALTRPEAVGAVACTCAAGCALLLPADRRRFVRAFGVYFLLPGLCYLGWRLWLFGDFWPNPFYVKHAAHVVSASGIGYVLRFFGGAVFPFSLLACRQLLRMRLSGPEALPVLAAGAICSFYALFFCTVTPLMGEGFRFLVPVLPILLWLCAEPLEMLFHGLAGMRRVVLVLVVLAFGYASQPERLIDLVRGTAPAGAQLMVVEAHLGRVLQPFQSGAPLVAWGDAGALAYYSGWRFLDTVGLNDNFIARSKNRPLKAVLDYVFNAQPTLILLPGEPGAALTAETVFKKGHGPQGSEIYLGLFEDARFVDYRYAATFATPVYALHAFVRRDAAIAGALDAALRRAESAHDAN